MCVHVWVCVYRGKCEKRNANCILHKQKNKITDKKKTKWMKRKDIVNVVNVVRRQWQKYHECNNCELSIGYFVFLSFSGNIDVVVLLFHCFVALKIVLIFPKFSTIVHSNSILTSCQLCTQSSVSVFRKRRA